MVQELLKRSARQALAAIQQLETESALVFMGNIAHLLADTFRRGGKVIIAGNGGSLCDAAHFAEELTGVFRAPRSPLPALVLNEAGHLSCVGNDLGFDQVFARGVEAFGQAHDVFIGLSTSGNSANIIHAFEAAKKKQLKTVAFLGKDGGRLAGVADYEWIVHSFPYSDRIQEAHMAAMHLIIEGLEHLLFHQQETIPSKIQISQYTVYGAP
jgi:D-sedoheptulose 7-phosphate isomerase